MQSDALLSFGDGLWFQFTRVLSARRTPAQVDSCITDTEFEPLRLMLVSNSTSKTSILAKEQGICLGDCLGRM